MTKKRIIFVWSMRFAILALGLLLLEAIFGSWVRPNYVAQLNLPRGLRVSLDVTDLYIWKRSHVTYSRDEYGLRGSFENPSAIDILTVGGSTTDQRYIDDEDTWQRIIQNEFHKIRDDVFLANAGIDGQSTYGHIKNLDWWFPNIPNLKPKFIVYYIGLNDFYKDDEYKYDDLVINEKSLQQFLRERSAFYTLFRKLKGIYLARYVKKVAHGASDFKRKAWSDKPLLQNYDNLMSGRLEAYAARLRILIDKTNLFGAIPVFVTQPSRMYRISGGKIFGLSTSNIYDGRKFNGVDFYYMMNRLNKVMMETCERYEAVCINLADEMFARWEDDDFYDISHMTPAGAKKVGLYLYSKLAEYL